MKPYPLHLILIGSFLLAIVNAGCGGGDTKNPQEAAREGLEQAVAVRIQEIQPQPFTQAISLTGTVKAIDDILVSPEEGGVVKEWKYIKGHFVKKGDLIVRLNDDVAKASYDAALAQYKAAQLNYEKQESVYSEQAVSEMQLKTSEYQRDAAKANADLLAARWQRTQIRAPVSGILDDRLVDEGEMASPGVPIARIVKIDRVKLLINVPERYAGGVVRGTPVTFTISNFPQDTFQGTIDFVGAAISADNRTFPVELVLKNPGLKLKPEMIAKARVVESVQKHALLLEESIVQLVDRDRQVVYIENGGKARERVVTLGGRQQNMVEVVSGLEPGDRVIISGYQNLVDGQTVTIVQ
jgi:membrane fusion protein (multidrug efflux system)